MASEPSFDQMRRTRNASHLHPVCSESFVWKKFLLRHLLIDNIWRRYKLAISFLYDCEAKHIMTSTQTEHPAGQLLEY